MQEIQVQHNIMPQLWLEILNFLFKISRNKLYTFTYFLDFHFFNIKVMFVFKKKMLNNPEDGKEKWKTRVLHLLSTWGHVVRPGMLWSTEDAMINTVWSIVYEET